MKPLHVALIAGVICLSVGVGLKSGKFLEDKLSALQSGQAIDPEGRIMVSRSLFMPFNESTVSGNYLAAHFAQAEYDWSSATQFMDKVLSSGKTDPQLIRRAMVISMGSGDTTRAFALAGSLLEKEPTNSLGLLFKSIEALQKQDFTQSKAFIDKIPVSDNVDFIVPVMRGWIDAATGTLNPEKLKDGSIHIYHAIYIADYMKRPDIIEYLVGSALKIPQITAQDMDRLGDFYVHIGKGDKALPLYEKILVAVPGEPTITAKVNAIKSGLPIDNFKGVQTPTQGVSIAMEDMAQTLFQEYSDDSARVFAQLAVFLNPQLTIGRMLLAEIAARHERFEDAISFYQSVPDSSPDYVQAHRRAADLLEDAGHENDALKEINKIINAHGDVDAMMQAGDIYRRHDDYNKALDYYNKAADKLGNPIPQQYWTLYYARGMAYERLNQWNKAEADLKAALAYQPENPMVLNYLGYAWADQGINLDESLNMIRKAVSLSPDDGYITDSLGWVLFRKGSYQEAVPHLERAVELLPYDPTINDHLGDAYWRVGRKLEARFQWERAKADSKDAALTAKIDDKLANGLPQNTAAQDAPAHAAKDGDVKKQ